MPLSPTQNHRAAWLGAIALCISVLIIAIHFGFGQPKTDELGPSLEPVPPSEAISNDKPQMPEPAPEIGVPASSLPPEANTTSLEVGKDSTALHLPILIYHYVRDTVHSRDILRYQMNVPPAIFEAQLQTLIDDGFHFVSLSQIADALEAKIQLPEKPMAITLDDGYEDVYSTVFPILKKTQAKITAFLITDYLDHKKYLKSPEVEELLKSGLVEIGSHTLNHPHLDKLKDDLALKQIAESKALLEKDFGSTVSAFAYPYGLFNKQTPKLVEGAGYRIAVSTIYGADDSLKNRYFLPRINVGQRIGKKLLDFISAFK